MFKNRYLFNLLFIILASSLVLATPYIQFGNSTIFKTDFPFILVGNSATTIINTNNITWNETYANSLYLTYNNIYKSVNISNLVNFSINVSRSSGNYFEVRNQTTIKFRVSDRNITLFGTVYSGVTGTSSLVGSSSPTLTTPSITTYLRGGSAVTSNLTIIASSGNPTSGGNVFIGRNTTSLYLNITNQGNVIVASNITALTGYNAADGTAGATGTIDLTSATSITVKNGLIVSWS